VFSTRRTLVRELRGRTCWRAAVTAVERTTVPSAARGGEHRDGLRHGVTLRLGGRSPRSSSWRRCSAVPAGQAIDAILLYRLGDFCGFETPVSRLLDLTLTSRAGRRCADPALRRSSRSAYVRSSSSTASGGDLRAGRRQRPRGAGRARHHARYGVEESLDRRPKLPR
jgi:hypothetical protein